MWVLTILLPSVSSSQINVWIFESLANKHSKWNLILFCYSGPWRHQVLSVYVVSIVHMQAVVAHSHVHMFVFRAVHSSINGTTAIPWRNSRRRLPLLEQLRGCQEAWCPGAPWDREEAHAAVCGTPAGVSSPTHQSHIFTDTIHTMISLQLTA